MGSGGGESAMFTYTTYSWTFVIVFRWSNVNRPGQWLFQVGPVDEGENIKTPVNIEGNMKKFKKIIIE